MTLKWTKTRPTELGVWWIKFPNGDTRPAIIHPPYIYVAGYFDSLRLEAPRFDDCEWQGPIKPDEPEGTS